MSPWTVGLFGLGIALLVAGAELLVRGASALARAANVAPLIIGLTVVAFGTSAPELAVSVQAGLVGQDAVALGNVIGSNIANVLLILGISALITPLVVHQQIISKELPLMLGLSVLTLLLGLDGAIGWIDGLALLLILAGWIAVLFRQGRHENADVKAQYDAELGGPADRSLRTIALHAALVLAGLAMLVLGARWLVEAATDTARALGVSDLVIGLTVVAVGTSLPELATSAIAALRGERDIAVGNVIGSNVFNILGVLGAAALFTPDGVTVPHAALIVDLPVMIGVALACLPIFYTGHRVDRWEGALLLALYAAYVAWLILDSLDHPHLTAFASIMS